MRLSKKSWTLLLIALYAFYISLCLNFAIRGNLDAVIITMIILCPIASILMRLAFYQTGVYTSFQYKKSGLIQAIIGCVIFVLCAGYYVSDVTSYDHKYACSELKKSDSSILESDMLEGVCKNSYLMPTTFHKCVLTAMDTLNLATYVSSVISEVYKAETSEDYTPVIPDFEYISSMEEYKGEDSVLLVRNDYDEFVNSIKEFALSKGESGAPNMDKFNIQTEDTTNQMIVMHVILILLKATYSIVMNLIFDSYFCRKLKLPLLKETK